MFVVLLAVSEPDATPLPGHAPPNNLGLTVRDEDAGDAAMVPIIAFVLPNPTPKPKPNSTADSALSLIEFDREETLVAVDWANEPLRSLPNSAKDSILELFNKDTGKASVDAVDSIKLPLEFTLTPMLTCGGEGRGLILLRTGEPIGS